jgi:hypothetical protein
MSSNEPSRAPDVSAVAKAGAAQSTVPHNHRQRPDPTTRRARRRRVAADHARTTEGDIDA